MKTKAQVLMAIILVILLIVLGFLAYLLYQYIPGEPKQLKAIIEKPKLEIGNLSYEVKQFYPNMKFNHNSISYKIDSACSEEKKERMIKAFNELSDEVDAISFYEAEKPDIEVSCSVYTKSIEEEFFIAGEGGANEIVQTGRYNVITKGVVLLHKSPHEFQQCDWPNVELHELLHVFGFEHSQAENSLMYPYLKSCEQKLDGSIVRDLKELYSKEDLADLYFEKVEAIRRGRYLDFNVTVKNSGVVDAENVFLSVFDNNEKVEDFNLNNVSFGGGITFHVTNLGLRSRSSEEINIVIDATNSIKEIDEGNNVARLVFA